MARGHLRWRGRSIEVRVHIGAGKYETRTIPWQGTKTATTKAAERELRALLDDHDRGHTAGSDKTVAQLVTRWRRNAEPGWAPGTTRTYVSYLNLHVLPAIGHLKLHEVHPAVLDDLYADLRKKGLSPASVRKVHVIIRRAFSDAVRLRWLPTNPAADASPPTVPRPELHPPSEEQVRLLLTLAAERDPMLHCFLVLAADLGARRGELCALRWSDFSAGDVTISRSVAEVPGGVIVKDTKTHQSRRVALGQVALEVVEAFEASRREQFEALGAKWADGFLFSNDLEGKTPWRPDGATSRFVRLREQAGLSVRLHDLRHALITEWLSAGVDPRTVMGRVGHASLQTLTRYAHFVAAADREAAAKMGSRLQSTTSRQ